MSESRSNTICVVVERPDHHCVDDLVTKIFGLMDPDRRIQAFENKCYRKILDIYTNIYGKSQHSDDSPYVGSFHYQPSSVASCHGSAMSNVMIRYLKSNNKEQQLMVVVSEEDRVNHGRITLWNVQASRFHHCWLRIADDRCRW